MKQLDKESNNREVIEECSALVMETIPRLMRTIRWEVKSQRPIDLSASQFRTLRFLKHHPGTSLSQLAENVDVSMPSMSKAVDILVVQGLVNRESAVDDRRRILLTLTIEGEEMLQEMRTAMRACLAERLNSLNVNELTQIIEGMQILRSIVIKEEASITQEEER
ncbi:MAG: MarR family transcriptional regulator [bacterium]